MQNNVSTQESNINLVLRTEALRKKCISEIHKNNILTYSDKSDCSIILLENDIEKYWSLDTFVRDMFMNTVERCTKEYLSRNDALVISNLTLSVVRDLMGIAEQKSNRSFTIQENKLKTIKQLLRILPFYNIKELTGNLYSISKLPTLTVEQIIARHRLFFGFDSPDYKDRFRFICTEHNKTDRTISVFDTFDTVTDVITIEQLVEYTKLGIQIYRAFVLFDGTICIG